MVDPRDINRVKELWRGTERGYRQGLVTRAGELKTPTERDAAHASIPAELARRKRVFFDESLRKFTRGNPVPTELLDELAPLPESANV